MDAQGPLALPGMPKVYLMRPCPAMSNPKASKKSKVKSQSENQERTGDGVGGCPFLLFT
jgi:hypothetical protein